MKEKLVEDQIFEKEDFTTKYLTKGDYDYCTFINCNFLESNLADIRFLECEFKDCNLSLVKLHKTIFRDVKFFSCKMMGLNIDEGSQFNFSVNFHDCILNYSSFYAKVIKNAVFKNTSLHEVDFSGCDLTGASFDGCDMKDAKFENTNLEKCDFREATNYIIDPVKNRLKKTKFSLEGLPGLLYNYDILIS